MSKIEMPKIDMPKLDMPKLDMSKLGMTKAKKVKIKKPTIVIFDMDGTTVRHVNPAFLHFLEMLDNLLYKLKRPFRRKRKLTDYSRDPARPRGLLVHRMLHKFRRKSVDQIVQPCPGIFSLLKFFRSQNIPIGLASNGLGKGYGHDILEKFDLADYFNCEIFREDVEKSKPHPDGLMRCLRQLKPDFNENDVVWHIGDRAKDVKATLNADKIAECQFVPFAYGINAAIAILQTKVSNEHIIITYPDFLEYSKDVFGIEEDLENR